MRNVKKNIAWLTPWVGEGSGGQRTVLQNLSYLEQRGYGCDLYVGNYNSDAGGLKEKLLNLYDIKIEGDVYKGYNLKKKYDAVVATYYSTAKKAAESDCKHKIYFIQDYEPWFFPMTGNYLDAEESYNLKLKGITIGRWLSKKIRNDFAMDVNHFSFCSDLDIYKPVKNIKKEKAVCFVFQPDKPRRMADLGLKALQIVQKKCPDVKIYLYGSRELVPHNLDAKHLGVISVEDCNALYNKCMVGLCLSATNPSRIPFEMMAAGLPVVELYKENNLYDFPTAGCILAERTPESVAEAILKILNSDKIYKKLSQGGVKYMKMRPLERGFQEFGDIIEKTIKGQKVRNVDREILYTSRPIRSKEKIEIEDVYFTTLEEEEAKKIAEEEAKRRAEEEEKRRNYSIPKKVYLKVRWILFKR